MSSQVLDLGPGAFGDLTWEGAILVDAGLIDGTTAYLRFLQLRGNSLVVRLATSPTADPEDAGPEFTAAFETAEAAFTFAEAGGDSVVLKGPAHPANTFVHPTEPYFWTPDNGAALNAWVRGSGSGVVTLTLDDGQVAPPVISATFDGASGSLSLALTKRVLLPETISATFDGASGSLSLALTKRALLTLADFERGGLEFDVLALIEAGAPPSIYGIAPRIVSGALLDGEMGMGETDEPITWLRFSESGALITLNDNGPLRMSTHWRETGPGGDLTLHVQTEQGHISFPVVGNRGRVGSNFIYFHVPSEHQVFLDGIVEGERLIFASARPRAVTVTAKPIAATFAAAAASLAAGLTKRSLADRPIAATFAAAAASLAAGLTKRSLADRPIAATFAAAAASLAAGLTKRSLADRPIAATFAAAAASLAAGLTKRSRPTQPIAATFAAAAASVTLALAKPTALPESVRRRIRSTSGSWDGVRVGDLVAVGRATSYAREVEVATVRYDDRNVRLTLVDYPETLYAGERPLGDFRPGDTIPGPYLGPACPEIRSIHTGVDDVGQNRAGTNPILIRIEIAPDDSSRPAARAYIVQCRQSEFAGSPAENDDPVLQSLPDAEYLEQPGSDWEDCGIVEKPGQGTLVLSSGFAIGERIDIRVIALDDEGRASCWRVYEDYLVELPVAAAPGARLHFGVIDPDPEAAPDDAIGEDGDRFIADDGRTWVKVDGAWVFQGDFTGVDGTKIYSGEVAEDALPPGDVGTIGDLYFAFDGRWWEKTDETTWTPRGDLTGPAGSGIFTGSGAPSRALGEDGDVYVSDDGIVWRKANGVWTQTGVDLTGKPGSKLFSGEVADGAKPPPGTGSVDDFFLASDGRFWEKTAAATWTLRGDLTGPAGSNIFTGSGAPQAALGKDGDVYVSDDGIVWRKANGVWTQTGVDLTGKPGSKLFSGEVADGAKPPAGTGSVDDFFLASDGRFWEKTAAATWTLRGDLTGPAGSNIFTGSGAPQAALGKDGDVFVSDDGIVWRKANGVWTQTGVDLTGKPGSKLFSGEVADGAKPPAGTGSVDDFFLASDGRFWEKTAAATWTLRGDLTGPAGSNIFTGSGAPQAALGKDGDVFVSDDGTVWTKANGVWTQTGHDLTGPPGTKLIPGEVAEGASPGASIGMVGDVFLAFDGRWWEKTDPTTWTLRGDLTGSSGSDIFTGSGAPDPALGKDGDVYVRDDGTLWSKANGVWTYTGVDVTGPKGASLIPGDVAEGASPDASLGEVGDITGPPGASLIPGVVAPDALPPANVGKVGDTFLAADGRFWQKTDATTWTYIDDLTGPEGTGGIIARGEWSSGTSYAVGDSVYRNFRFSHVIRPPGGSITIVRNYSRAYLCKLAHTADASNSPSGSGNAQWDALLGGESEDTEDPTTPPTTMRSETVYQRRASAPSAPSGTAETIPSGWSESAPEPTATQPVWASTRTATYNTTTNAFVSAGAWGAPVKYEEIESVYRLSTSTPLPPSGGTSTPNHRPSGYQFEKPDATTTHGVYESQRTVTYNATTGVFDIASVWGRPVLIEPSRPSMITTTSVTRYRLASSTPETPGSSAENPPSGWRETRPAPSLTESIYKLVGTRTYDALVFQSAVWAVTFVRGPIVLVQSFEYIYRRATSTPAAPAGGTSTENHRPSGWDLTDPGATTTQGVYRSNRSVRYEDGVFIRASAWRTPVEIEPPIVLEQLFEYVYRRGFSTPATPSGGTSTESHVPTGWRRNNPGATTTQGVYRSERSVRYENGVFIRATAWRTPTRVNPPGAPGRGGETVEYETVEYVYRLAFALPPAASGGTSIEDHVPVGWSFTRATPTAVAGLFRSDRTTSSEDGVFVDATDWSAPTRVRWPIAVVDTHEYVYRRGLTTPLTPSGGTSTEHHAPDGWSTIDPGPTPTQGGVYRAERSARSEDGVFVSATAWSAPIGPIGVPGGEGS